MDMGEFIADGCHCPWRGTKQILIGGKLHPSFSSELLLNLLNRLPRNIGSYFQNSFSRQSFNLHSNHLKTQPFPFLLFPCKKTFVFICRTNVIHLVALLKHLSNGSLWNSFFVTFYQFQNNPICFLSVEAHLRNSMPYFCMDPGLHTATPHRLAILRNGRRIEMPT